jgi:hypothetical protein
MRLPATALVLALAAALPWPAARADPRYAWETLDTPHFEVHYHQGELQLAQRVARAAELAHQRLTPLLDHVPRERCQLVLVDDTDYANGFASPLFYDHIGAFAAPPDPRSTLGDFDDAVWQLISHEYTHILHLDTVGGLPAAVNDLFGKVWIPNGVQPTWFIEGLAVLSESRVSAGGRLRASLEELSARTQALEQRFPSIDRLSNPSLIWPRGNEPYTLGGRFLGFLEEEFGAGALRALSHDFGSRAIPLGLNLSAEKVLGESYLALYRDYRARELAEAQAVAERVRAAGESRPEQLTRLGEQVGSPRFSRDGGTVYYASTGPDRLPELRALPLGPCCSAGAAPEGETGPGDRRLTTSFGTNRLAVTPEGRLVHSRPEVFQEFELVEDLYLFDPRTGDEARLTRGLRASEPDVAPDGTIAFVQRHPAGRTTLSLLPPGASEPQVLFEAPDGQPVASPRWSPSGGALVFLQHRQSWDVRLIGRDGNGLADLTADRAFDRDPVFSPGGDWVLFSSDRDGLFDVYAVHLADRRLVRVTHLLDGGFEPEPAPDGKQLVLVGASARGFDLQRLPVDLASLPALPAETAPAQADLLRPAETPLPQDELYPSRPYHPLPTLLPKWWLPYFAVDAAGSTAGLVTSGSDAAGRHDYAATLWWGLDGGQPGWSLRYTNHTLYPDLSFTASRDLVTPSGARSNRERDVQVGAAATFPWSSYQRSLAFTAGFDLVRMVNDQDPDGTPLHDGTATVATLQLSYSDAHRFVRSVSDEQGQRFTATFRLSDPALGSAFAYRQLAAAYSTYLRLPWSRGGLPLHHALALRISGGVGRGDLSERHLFSLGGFDTNDWLRALVNPQDPPLRVLRGFRQSAFSGESFALGSAEYRLPLWDVEAGPWTLPVYLRRLHGALFADAGDAFTVRRSDFQLHLGTGAELRAETVLGWTLPADFRLGCARGLGGPQAIWDCYFAAGGIF